MTVDLATLATKALADDRVATKGPWEVIADDNAQQNIYADHGFDWIAMLPHQCVSSIEDMRVVDAAFIAAARTREPLLAAGVLDLTRQLAEARRIGDAALDHELRLHNEQLRKFSEERLDLTRQLAEANRELERWRHGVTIEGDFVCPDSLALSEALRVNVDLTRQMAEARAGNERLRETYKRVSSVHADRASRTDDLQQQLATARVEADALRAARDGLADLLSGLVHRFERGGAYTARIAELRAVGAKP